MSSDGLRLTTCFLRPRQDYRFHVVSSNVSLRFSTLLDTCSRFESSGIPSREIASRHKPKTSELSVKDSVISSCSYWYKSRDAVNFYYLFSRMESRCREWRIGLESLPLHEIWPQLGSERVLLILCVDRFVDRRRSQQNAQELNVRSLLNTELRMIDAK